MSKYVNSKDITKMLVENREMSLTDDEIFQKLKTECDSKRLAMIIASTARNDHITKNKWKNNLLIILLIVFALTSIITYIICFSVYDKFSIFITELVISLICISIIKPILRFNKTSYKLILGFSLLYFSACLFTFKEIHEFEIVLLLVFNTILSLIITVFSFYLDAILFPNYPPVKDKNGDYIFKE